MPTFPNKGELDWGTKMKTWLRTSLNPDGTVIGAGSAPSMATFPDLGEPGWRDELYGWLQVAHNPDGTLRGGIGGGSPAAPGNDPRIYVTVDALTAGTAYSTVGMSTAALSGLARSMIYWVIDPFSSKAERLPAWQAIGSAVYVSDDAYTQGHTVPWHPIYDHSAGAIVIACTNDEISPAMFAAIGDNATDDWRALQKFFQLTSGFTVFGGSPVNKYKSNRPFVVLEHSHMKEFAIRFDIATFDVNCIQASIPDNNGGGNNGNWNVSESQAQFVVASPGTTIVLTNADMTHMNNPVKFADVINNLCPPQLVEMRMYKLINISQVGPDVHANVADYSAPTTPIALTPGSGLAWYNFTSHIHQYMDGVEFESNVQNMDLYQIWLQNQPGRTRDMVGKAFGTGTETCFVMGGQLSHHTNIVCYLGPTGIKAGVSTGGTGHIYSGISVFAKNADMTDATNPNAVALIIGGNNCYADKVHGERVGIVVDFQGANDCLVDSVSAKGLVGANRAIVRASNVDQAWQVNRIQTDDLGVCILDLLGSRGIKLFSWDGDPVSGVGDTDEHGVFPGIVHPAGASTAPVLMNRVIRSWTPSGGATTFKMRRIYKGLQVLGTSNSDVWLSDMGPFFGHEVFIRKETGTGTMQMHNPDGTNLGAGITAAGIYRYIWMGVWVSIT